MITIPVVDSHLHLWDPKNLRYPWLDANALLNKPYLPEAFRAACGPVQVEQMVFVQCECVFSQFMDEVNWITHLTHSEPRITGMVPWAPLENGDAVRSDLEKLAGSQLVKGIRRIIEFEPDLDFCLQPGFVKGVQALTGYGLSFDICISHRQMANAIKLVSQCPNVQFILDHIGKPDIKNHVFEPWNSELKTLAKFSNVWCKLSGLVTEADHKLWKKEDLKPYINHVLECFGFDRVMYGGDWPVAYQATQYPRWVETLEWAVSGCTETELRRLFHDNAIAFYRLK